jgi:hypothetical protein
MLLWKVPKWSWFLTEVAVKPFWDLATLRQMRKVTSAVRNGEIRRFPFSEI